METPNFNDFTNEQMPTHQLEEEWQKELLGIADVDQADHNWFSDRLDDLRYGKREAEAMRQQIECEIVADGGDTAAVTGVAWQYARELRLAGIDPSTVDNYNVTDIVEKLRYYSGDDWATVKVAASKLDNADNRRQGG